MQVDVKKFIVSILDRTRKNIHSHEKVIVFRDKQFSNKITHFLSSNLKIIVLSNINFYINKKGREIYL